VNRLGIYVDDVYRIGGDGRISSDRAFLLFACEVGRRFDRLTVFGRAVRSPTPADYRLQPEVELIGLPHYDDLKAVRAVARASGGTARAMWRGLAQTDTVWIFGPHPFGYLLLVLALLRRKRVCSACARRRSPTRATACRTRAGGRRGCSASARSTPPTG
jgi:hypothetical protein